jgi:hypothetical protein
MEMKQILSTLFIIILLSPFITNGQMKNDISHFYPAADSTCQYPELHRKITIQCQQKIDSLYVTLMGYKDQKKIFIAAVTRKPITDPDKEISRTVVFNETRPSLGKTATWGYVFDRNNDGKIDYMALVGGAAAFKEEQQSENFPARGNKPTLKQLEYFIAHCKLIFNHWADDNYDGKIDGVVHIDMDPMRDWVERMIVARSANFYGAPNDAWAFRDNILTEHETIIRTNSGIPYYPLGEKQSYITSAMLFEKTAYMELFNRAVSQCKIGKNGLGVK